MLFVVFLLVCFVLNMVSNITYLSYLLCFSLKLTVENQQTVQVACCLCIVV